MYFFNVFSRNIEASVSEYLENTKEKFLIFVARLTFRCHICTVFLVEGDKLDIAHDSFIT